MKIAFLMSEFPCSSQTFILSQLTGLIDRGYEIDVYAHKKENAHVVHSDVGKYNLETKTYYFTEGRLKVPRNNLVRWATAFGALIIIHGDHGSRIDRDPPKVEFEDTFIYQEGTFPNDKHAKEPSVFIQKDTAYEPRPLPPLLTEVPCPVGSH